MPIPPSKKPPLVYSPKVPRISPEVAALLPIPIRAGDYKIEFLDVGFASQQNKHSNGTGGKGQKSDSLVTYFFSYRVSRTDDKPLGDGEEKHVTFRGFTLADGSRTETYFGNDTRGNSKSAKGQSWWSDKIDRHWKNVTTNWSIRPSNSNEEAEGYFTSRLAWKNVPIPSLEGEKTFVHQQQKTKKGTLVCLESTEKEGSGLRLNFEFRPHTKVNDYFLWPRESQFILSDGTQWNSLVYPAPFNEGDGVWKWTLIPRSIGSQTSVNFSMLLQERSSSWKDQKVLKEFQVRLPVASLIKAV